MYKGAALADPRNAPGMWGHGRPNSLTFIQFSAKILQNNPTTGVGAPNSKKNLDPPLDSTILAPPAGRQVMGLSKNNWYPALQIIL